MKRARIRTVIEHIGSVSKVAADCDVSTAAVYQWIIRNSLPLERALAIGEQLGIDPDLLHDPWVGRRYDVMTEEETKSLLTGV